MTENNLPQEEPVEFKEVDCNVCDGTGYVTRMTKDGHVLLNSEFDTTRKCTKCDGTGRILVPIITDTTDTE